MLTRARENEDKGVQRKLIQNLIIYMVAIEYMYCQLTIFSLMYCIDGPPVKKFTYAPIEKRDMMRIDYLNNKIWKNDVTSANMLDLIEHHFSVLVNFFMIVAY
jgi:hypothetical protein